MLKMIVIIAAAVLGALLLFAASRPDTFHVQRSATIKAPSDKILALINDFHRWPTWWPYEKLDPAMKRSFGGAERGQGSVYAWDGNRKAGAGRAEIVEATPSHTKIQLDFTRPFEAHNIAEFTLERHDGLTTVTWAMHGPSPFIAKLFGIFFSMDRVVGKEFESGLANLKAACEM